MFAHAGDSDDEDEDRENLVRSGYNNSTQRNIFRTLIQVGEVEEEREDERERQEEKRRNYQLMVERATRRRRGSTDSVEDQVMAIIRW